MDGTSKRIRRKLNTAPDYNGTKHCGQCGSTKARIEFYRAAYCGDGLATSCKLCAKSYASEWAKANAERNRANTARWIKANPEMRKDAVAKWRQANADKLKADFIKWRNANPDRSLAISVRHTIRRRNAKAASGGSFTARQWRALVDEFGSRCVCCGIMPPKLSVDHVVPLMRGGSNLIENIQPLCLSCNRAKNVNATDYRDTPFMRTGKTAA
jgi:5-methylcytosine-specific restriction endonuclease McrA